MTSDLKLSNAYGENASGISVAVIVRQVATFRSPLEKHTFNKSARSKIGKQQLFIMKKLSADPTPTGASR